MKLYQMKIAKRRAISLLDICLNNHHLNASEQRDLILGK